MSLASYQAAPPRCPSCSSATGPSSMHETHAHPGKEHERRADDGHDDERDAVEHAPHGPFATSMRSRSAGLNVMGLRLSQCAPTSPARAAARCQMTHTRVAASLLIAHDPEP